MTRGEYLRNKLKNGTGKSNEEVSEIGKGATRTTSQNSSELAKNLAREGRAVGNGETAAPYSCFYRNKRDIGLKLLIHGTY